jgi:hypothetical protein
MSAPDNIRQLVEHFEEQREAYHKGNYTETQLRADFLNPFFEALGWDVLNHKGHAEKYREVILEASAEVEGQAKAADYAFRVGDKPLFFCGSPKTGGQHPDQSRTCFPDRAIRCGRLTTPKPPTNLRCCSAFTSARQSRLARHSYPGCEPEGDRRAF